MNDWRLAALCRGVDPEVFFPDEADERTRRKAKAVCAGCPVRAECLAEALRLEVAHGVWGGLGPKQRNALRPRPSAQRRARWREAHAASLPPDTPHGLYRYKTLRCRCEECRAANSAYSSRNRARRLAERAS